MGIGNQILFLLAGLGVFNGILLVCYFLFLVKPKRWINVLFGLLMLMLCIRIGKSLFYVFIDIPRIYRQIGLSACIMIGPLLYLYVKHFLSNIKRPSKLDSLHIIIPLLGILVVGIIWPYQTHPDYWNHRIVKGIYLVWAFYLIYTSTLLAPLFPKVLEKKAPVSEKWILLVYTCMALLCLAYILAYYGFPYVSGPLLFSLAFYVLIGFLFWKKNRSSILYEEPHKYQNRKISDEKAEKLLLKLSETLESQQTYLNPKVKLIDIAASIDSTPHELSQLINSHQGISFNHYINTFRVKAACSLLRESDHFTVEGIGQEVGFNSRSAFYTAFKTIMKQTPAQYKAYIKQV